MRHLVTRIVSLVGGTAMASLERAVRGCHGARAKMTTDIHDHTCIYMKVAIGSELKGGGKPERFIWHPPKHPF